MSVEMNGLLVPATKIYETQKNCSVLKKPPKKCILYDAIYIKF
jgi:hypothetical protein